jgi:hypothetical protein
VLSWHRGVRQLAAARPYPPLRRVVHGRTRTPCCSQRLTDGCARGRGRTASRWRARPLVHTTVCVLAVPAMARAAPACARRGAAPRRPREGARCGPACARAATRRVPRAPRAACRLASCCCGALGSPAHLSGTPRRAGRRRLRRRGRRQRRHGARAAASRVARPDVVPTPRPTTQTKPP